MSKSPPGNSDVSCSSSSLLRPENNREGMRSSRADVSPGSGRPRLEPSARATSDTPDCPRACCVSQAAGRLMAKGLKKPGSYDTAALRPPKDSERAKSRGRSWP